MQAEKQPSEELDDLRLKVLSILSAHQYLSVLSDVLSLSVLSGSHITHLESLKVPAHA